MFWLTPCVSFGFPPAAKKSSIQPWDAQGVNLQIHKWVILGTSSNICVHTCIILHLCGQKSYRLFKQIHTTASCLVQKTPPLGSRRSSPLPFSAKSQSSSLYSQVLSVFCKVTSGWLAWTSMMLPQWVAITHAVCGVSLRHLALSVLEVVPPKSGFYQTFSL